GKEVIEEAKCGKCVFAGDFEGLAKIMKEYIEYPHEFDACGLNGRNFFKSNFTKEKYMERLLGILNNMIGERR
ncbi:MAG: hypothetical protein J6D04_03045, partial [Clostridia bacterium]|nr:hypothetical protein [Clostridia bacterium]